MPVYYGTNASETIDGSAGEDTLFGWDKNNAAGDRGPDTDNDTIRAGGGNDEAEGGGGDDSIDGGEGSDRLLGQGGNDTLLGSAVVDAGSYDSLAGGAGDDTIRDSWGLNSRMSGDDGDDRFTIGSGMGGLILGGSGTDELTVELFGIVDSLIGPELEIRDVEILSTRGFIVSASAKQFESFDTIRRSEADPNGSVVLISNAGGTLDVADELGGRAAAIYGVAARDRIISGEGADSLFGREGADVLSGVGGADQLNGEQGDDTLNGGAGNDTLDGGQNKDSLSGGAGQDSLKGGDGDDTIEGGNDEDTLDGGTGVNTLSYANSNARVEVSLLAGTLSGGDADGDTFSNFRNLTGSAFADSLVGDNEANLIVAGGGSASLGFGGGDVLKGNGGADTLNGGDGVDYIEGGAGSDRIIGGDGLDFATYQNSGERVEIDLSTGIGKGGDAKGDRLSGIELVFGSDFDDRLVGKAGFDILAGGLGDDTILGSSGADWLIGSVAIPIFGGGVGSGDQFFVGRDTVSYADSKKGVTVELYTAFVTENGLEFTGAVKGRGGDAQGDIIAGFTDIVGSAHDDVLTGYAGIPQFETRSELSGRGGDDLLQGGYGGDRFDGGAGSDTVSYDLVGRLDILNERGVTIDLAKGRASGTFTADGDRFISIENAIGTSFADSLIGDRQANVLEGGGGKDRLTGGLGADRLEGGAKADIFDFNSIKDSGPKAAARDTIVDFSHAQKDRIDLSGIDANANVAKNQAFSYIGDQDFSGKAGELHTVDAGRRLVVEGDVNGDKRADFAIELIGVDALVSKDFIL